MHRHDHDARALRAALAVTITFFVIELLGGWMSNSLALLSDAVHMLGDAGALGLGLFALWIAGRTPTESKTYGFLRAEILAALVNGIALWLIVIWIAIEALSRFAWPEQVHVRTMSLVAAAGLGANLACAWILFPRRHASLNVRAALLHIAADLLGSIGTLVAAGVISFTDWHGADALASLFIGVLIVISSWGLLREAVDILMEAAPPHVDLDALRRALEAIDGTDHVHDLHVWTLTTGQYALSAHAVVKNPADGEQILCQMRAMLAKQFEIGHVTIQLESAQPCEPDSVHL